MPNFQERYFLEGLFLNRDRQHASQFYILSIMLLFRMLLVCFLYLFSAHCRPVLGDILPTSLSMLEFVLNHVLLSSKTPQFRNNVLNILLPEELIAYQYARPFSIQLTQLIQLIRPINSFSYVTCELDRCEWSILRVESFEIRSAASNLWLTFLAKDTPMSDPSRRMLSRDDRAVLQGGRYMVHIYFESGRWY